MSLVTPDNLAEVLTALGVILTAVGGFSLWRGRKDPAPAGTPDALSLALAKLTAVTEGQAGNFTHNMQLFEKTNDLVEDLIDETRENRRVLEAMRDHLSTMRDAAIRGQK